MTRVRKVVPVGFLSNMNAFQWPHYDAMALTSGFDYRFLSFELGFVKPDPQIFEAVSRRLPQAPGRILFLDDNAINVHAGAAAGFQSHHVRGIDEAHRVLEACGVLET